MKLLRASNLKGSLKMGLLAAAVTGASLTYKTCKLPPNDDDTSTMELWLSRSIDNCKRRLLDCPKRLNSYYDTASVLASCASGAVGKVRDAQSLSTKRDVKDQVLEASAIFLADMCTSPDAGARSFAKFMFSTGFVGQLIDALPFYTTSAGSPFVDAMVMYLKEMLKTLNHGAATRSGVPIAVLALCNEYPDLGEAATDAIGPLLAEWTCRRNTASGVSSKDLDAAIAAVGWARKQKKGGTLERRLALQYVTTWTVSGGSTIANVLARTHNLGPTLAETAAAPFDSTARECAALMLSLAHHTPRRDLPFLRMDMWLYPLACFCADAGIEGDQETVSMSLRAMKECLRKGVEVPEGLYRHALGPLLRHAYSTDAWSKPDVAAVIEALAPSGIIPLDQRLVWFDWLLTDALNGPLGSNAAVISAISALCTRDVDGLHVLHTWLASLIVTLTTEKSSTEKSGTEKTFGTGLKDMEEEFEAPKGGMNPAYARGVASDILEISDRLGHYTEPPASAEEWLSPAAIATYPAIAAVVDEELADVAVRRGLKVVSALASIDKERESRFLRAGGLHLLHRLILCDDRSSKNISREVANLLATLSTDQVGATAIKNFNFDWLSWCDDIVQSSCSDCETSSSAAKVKINVEAITASSDKTERFRLCEGIHLFDPNQPHHAAIICNVNQESVVMDVVFVHGIRGGAFETWRRGRSLEGMTKSNCWPSAWLAPSLGPKVRLLTVEYSAPASAWEKKSSGSNDGPLEATAREVSRNLISAGVGTRPVVFVTHSMGGLVVKEMLARGWVPPASAVGLVFYSVPHAGSRLADLGWSLRFVGASPAKAVGNLTTGQEILEKLNRTIAGMNRRGLSVLSLSEGLPMRLSPPRMFHINAHVVPHESAYPGYGDFAVLDHHDHVTVCKPSTTDDPAYSLVYAFIKKRLDEINERRAGDDSGVTMVQLAVLP